MHIAQEMLDTTEATVAAIARRVGYESEEAFSRPFMRFHGSPDKRLAGLPLQDLILQRGAVPSSFMPFLS